MSIKIYSGIVVVSGQEQNFIYFNKTAVDTIGLPYDYDSIMHYPASGFSKNGRDTITPKHGVSRDRLGQRDRLTDLDKMHINIRYCPGT